jgi:hypothetical protein
MIRRTPRAWTSAVHNRPYNRVVLAIATREDIDDAIVGHYAGDNLIEEYIVAAEEKRTDETAADGPDKPASQKAATLSNQEFARNGVLLIAQICVNCADNDIMQHI